MTSQFYLYSWNVISPAATTLRQTWAELLTLPKARFPPRTSNPACLQHFVLRSTGGAPKFPGCPYDKTCSELLTGVVQHLADRQGQQWGYGGHGGP